MLYCFMGGGGCFSFRLHEEVVFSEVNWAPCSDLNHKSTKYDGVLSIWPWRSETWWRLWRQEVACSRSDGSSAHSSAFFSFPRNSRFINVRYHVVWIPGDPTAPICRSLPTSSPVYLFGGRDRRREWENNIVTYEPIARQRLLKHIYVWANARNRTSIARQSIIKKPSQQ
jgi:hypothetical protein